MSPGHNRYRSGANALMRCQIAEGLQGGNANLLAAIAGSALTDLVVAQVTDTRTSENYADAWRYLFESEEFPFHCELIGASAPRVRRLVRQVLADPQVLLAAAAADPPVATA